MTFSIGFSKAANVFSYIIRRKLGLRGNYFWPHQAHIQGIFMFASADEMLSIVLHSLPFLSRHLFLLSARDSWLSMYVSSVELGAHGEFWYS